MTAGIASVALALLSGSCADPSDTDADEARAALVEHLRSRTGAGTRLIYSRTLDEELPNVVYRPPDAEAFALAEVVVIGDVVDVEEGRAFHNDEAIESRDTEFDDPTADWRTFHLEIENVEYLAGEPPRGPLRIGLAVSGYDDPAVLREGLRTLRRVVLLLSTGGPVFAYDESLYRIARDGELLMTVDDDGRIDLPMMQPDLVAEFQGELRTVDDLRRALARPDRVIELTGANGVYSRPPDS